MNAYRLRIRFVGVLDHGTVVFDEPNKGCTICYRVLVFKYLATGARGIRDARGTTACARRVKQREFFVYSVTHSIVVASLRARARIVDEIPAKVGQQRRHGRLDSQGDKSRGPANENRVKKKSTASRSSCAHNVVRFLPVQWAHVPCSKNTSAVRVNWGGGETKKKTRPQMSEPIENHEITAEMARPVHVRTYENILRTDRKGTERL